MKRQDIKKALEVVGYTHDSIKSLLCGRAKPSFAKAQILFEVHNVPFEAWIDIKSYLNDTKQSDQQSSENSKQEVA